MRQLLAPLALSLILAACGGPTGGQDVGHPLGGKKQTDEGPVSIPLWVELACSAQGTPQWGKFSLIKLPSESVLWSLAYLDTQDCRVYGAIVPSGQKEADMCEIRFRSKKAVGQGLCKCVPGRYDLEEGRPTSDHCCEKYPNAIYCKPPTTSGDSAPKHPGTH